MKLRHIKGPKLDELEQALELIRVPLSIISVNFIGSTWYIHYAIVLDDKKMKVKREVANPTKTINPAAS